MTQQAKKMHELYEECKHIGFSETSDVIESAASAEEAEFFAKAFDIILQQKQKNVVAEKGFWLAKLIVFAGPNGSGKSTLYLTNRAFFDIPRVNVDEIVREIGVIGEIPPTWSVQGKSHSDEQKIAWKKRSRSIGKLRFVGKPQFGTSSKPRN